MLSTLLIFGPWPGASVFRDLNMSCPNTELVSPDTIFTFAVQYLRMFLFLTLLMTKTSIDCSSAPCPLVSRDASFCSFVRGLGERALIGPLFFFARSRSRCLMISNVRPIPKATCTKRYFRSTLQTAAGLRLSRKRR